jgi:hypothetical protein
MIDSVLEWVMGIKMGSIMKSRNGERHARFENAGKRLVPIPIWRERIGDWLVPHASSPIFISSGEYTGHCNKRPDFDRPEVSRESLRRVDVAGGSFKAYRLPRRIRVVAKVVWFAVAKGDASKTSRTSSGGHVARLRSRLKGVTAIGEDTNVGYGSVSNWEIEPIDKDMSWFAPNDYGSVLMRPMPIGNWLPENLIGFQAWHGRPVGPYWDKTTAVEIVRPC